MTITLEINFEIATNLRHNQFMAQKLGWKIKSLELEWFFCKTFKK